MSLTYTDAFMAQLRAMPEPAQIIYPPYAAVAEIQNGGLAQFFDNPTGALAPEAVIGFKKLGLIELASIVEEAIAFFPEPFPRDWDERREIIDGFDDEEADEDEDENDYWSAMSTLTDRFYNALFIDETVSSENYFSVAADAYIDQASKD